MCQTIQTCDTPQGTKAQPAAAPVPRVHDLNISNKGPAQAAAADRLETKSIHVT